MPTLPATSGSNALPGEPAGAEGGLEVVAADRTVEVEQLACDVEVRNDLALHAPRIDLVEGDAAGRHFGLLETERARNGDRKLFDGLNELPPAGLGQFRGPARPGQAELLDEGLAEPLRDPVAEGGR